MKIMCLPCAIMAITEHKGLTRKEKMLLSHIAIDSTKKSDIQTMKIKKFKKLADSFAETVELDIDEVLGLGTEIPDSFTYEMLSALGLNINKTFTGKEEYLVSAFMSVLSTVECIEDQKTKSEAIESLASSMKEFPTAMFLAMPSSIVERLKLLGIFIHSTSSDKSETHELPPALREILEEIGKF